MHRQREANIVNCYTTYLCLLFFVVVFLGPADTPTCCCIHSRVVLILLKTFFSGVQIDRVAESFIQLIFQHPLSIFYLLQLCFQVVHLLLLLVLHSFQLFCYVLFVRRHETVTK